MATDLRDFKKYVKGKHVLTIVINQQYDTQKFFDI